MPPPTGVGGGVASPRSYTTYGYSVYDARKPIVVQPPYGAIADAAHLARYDAAAPVPSVATQLPSIHEPSSCTNDGDSAHTQRWQPISRREPLECGVLWFLHISKTGGETVRHHLHGHARKHGWSYVDLYTRMLPHSLRRGGRWEVEHAVHTLARHLNTSKPKVVVHQHDGVGGFGDYFLDRVLRPLSCRFRAEGRGCEVIAITVLREPTARIISQARSDNLPLDIFPAYARAHANFQTKYTLFTTDWRVESLFQGNASVETSLLEPALSVLSHFELIGRTEDLAHFISVVDERMGWMAAPPPVPPSETSSEARAGSGSGREGNGGEGRNHSGTASAPSTTALHIGHRSKHEWNHTLAEVAIARHFNAIDAKTYHEAAVCRRLPVRPLCAAPVQATEGLPHYFTESDVVKPKLPLRWQMTFDGRSCHGYDLGTAYAYRCSPDVATTLGSTFGAIESYHREQSGRLVAGPAPGAGQRTPGG